MEYNKNEINHWLQVSAYSRALALPAWNMRAKLGHTYQNLVEAGGVEPPSAKQ